MKWPWKGITAGWCNSSLRWARSLAISLQLESESDRIFQVLICRPLRQPCSLLRTSQIFWGRSPRAGTSRKRSPRTRSGNSSSTSLPQLTPFTRCTAGWMLILITKRECLCRLIHGHLYDFPFFHYFSLLFKRSCTLKICICLNLYVIVFIGLHFSGLNYEINVVCHTVCEKNNKTCIFHQGKPIDNIHMMNYLSCLFMMDFCSEISIKQNRTT